MATAPPRQATPATPAANRPYVGRFAPSPTGDLHFGSLIAALGSFLDARHRSGRWLVRIEDIDRPRNVAGAADSILRDLERLGLEWDGEATHQSAFADRHQAALNRLRDAGWTFPCGCSRKEIGPGPYPGTCRNGLPPDKVGRSVRLRTTSAPIAFQDRVQGLQTQCLAEAVGDFVVHRADNVIAYHLAVAVDDDAAGVTDVVRGADLMDSTARQLFLLQVLGLTPPRYAHLPVASNATGQKLSKQTHARAISPRDPGALLFQALVFLGQTPPSPLATEPTQNILAWAVEQWCMEKVPGNLTIPAPATM